MDMLLLQAQGLRCEGTYPGSFIERIRHRRPGQVVFNIAPKRRWELLPRNSL
jgi:hypothetical protein